MLPHGEIIVVCCALIGPYLGRPYRDLGANWGQGEHSNEQAMVQEVDWHKINLDKLGPPAAGFYIMLVLVSDRRTIPFSLFPLELTRYSVGVYHPHNIIFII